MGRYGYHIFYDSQTTYMYESVAFWIACISTAFTARYAQKLSFATYHHDPYTAPFTIVGTTEDSSFNFSSEEYNSYFIFNTLIIYYSAF